MNCFPSPVCASLPSTARSAGRNRSSGLPGRAFAYRSTTSVMSPVPEQNPMMPAVYPRPSSMSSMYGYCASQSNEEFSALETSRIAIRFFAGSFSPTSGVPGAGPEQPDRAAAVRSVAASGRRRARTVYFTRPACQAGPLESAGAGRL